MKSRKQLNRFFILTIFFCLTAHFPLNAQQVIDLTFDKAVDIAMGKSYEVKQLNLGIERTRSWLRARQAGLKSRVYMNLMAPDFNNISEFKWNSNLQKDEIVRLNTRQWQMELSIRQPVILLGYPTNGYLSLNNEMYRYLQKDNGDKDVDYYNRYFFKFEQPLFLPNTLKNDIEEAELDLEREELEFIDDVVRMIDDIADDYYQLFRNSYRNVIYSHQISNLQQVSELVHRNSLQDTARSIEAFQIQVALANTQDNLLENQSDMRRESVRMTQRLRLDAGDSLNVEPVIKIVQITIDIDQALKYGFTLYPRLHMLNITRRRNEIELENTRGWDKFHVNLEMTFGQEKKDDQYQNLWKEQDNSYSASVNAYVPIWDWGKQKANIEAQKIDIQKTDLYIEENRNRIQSEIINDVTTLNEYQRRALSMQKNVAIAKDITARSILQFKENRISIQDILQIFERQNETELNFLEAYLGYKRSLLSLMENTHYDYENDISFIDKFRAQQ